MKDLEDLPGTAGLKEVIHHIFQTVRQRHRRSWQKMLRVAYPELKNDTIEEIMLKLVARCCWLRETAKDFAQHDFVEFCAGEGNLTMECLNAMLHGVALDIKYHPHHNMITSTGLRCWIDSISESRIHALVWFGTQCSSFVSICASNHKRNAENGFWGDVQREFVRKGNLMQVINCRAVLIPPSWPMEIEPPLRPLPPVPVINP